METNSASGPTANDLPAEHDAPHAFRDVPWWAWALVVTFAVVFMLGRSFTSLAFYDDESYVMMTIRTFGDGHRLYGDTYTQYGPAFYAISTVIHDWIGVPLTHDAGRLKTIFYWASISVLTGLTVMRLSESRLAGGLAAALTLMHIEKLGLEPSHPQEVSALAAALALWLLTFWTVSIGSLRSLSLFALAGACAAVAGLTKLNSGVLIALPLMAAAVWPLMQGGKLSKCIGSLCLAACVAVPTLIGLKIVQSARREEIDGRGDLIDAATAAWPFTIAVATLMTVAAIWIVSRADGTRAGSGVRPPPGKLAQLLVGLMVGAATISMAIIAWSLSTGTTTGELWWGLVAQHSFMSQSFYFPVIATPQEWFVVIFCGLMTGWQLRLWTRSDADNTKSSIASAVAPIALAIMIYFLVMEASRSLVHGLETRGAAGMLAIAGPFLMPLVLLRKISPSRIAMAMYGCIGPLLAYPVAGTQLSLGTISTLAGVVIVVQDIATSFDPRKASISLAPAVLRGGMVVALIAIIGSGSLFAWRWTQFVPLDQPGCRWVRLNPPRADLERSFADAIAAAPGDWLAFDRQNHNRFHFWTGKRPLTSISPTFWTGMVTPEQTQRIVDALEVAGEGCVVKQKPLAKPPADHVAAAQAALRSGWQPLIRIHEWDIGQRTVPAGDQSSAVAD